jgi:predicted acyl esterase
MKLLDVHPGGFAQRLNDGIVRARFRQGYDREVMLTPGSVERYDPDLWGACTRLASGHRLRVEVSSSDFTWSDIYDSRPVVMISENLAREVWGTPAAAVGRRIRQGADSQWRDIIGVVDDVRDNGVWMRRRPRLRIGHCFWTPATHEPTLYGRRPSSFEAERRAQKRS